MSITSGRVAALRAAAFVTASTYLAYGVSLVVGAIAARALGPDSYGRYAYVIWLTGALVGLANNGLTTSGIRFVAECLGRGQPDSANRVHGWLERRQLLALGLTLSVFAAWAMLFPPATWHYPAVMLIAICATCVATKTLYLFDLSIAKGHGNFNVEPSTTIVTTLLSGAGTVALAASGAPVERYLQLFAATCLLSWLLGRLLLRRASIRAQRGELTPELHHDLRHHLLWTVVLAIAATLGGRSVETYLLSTHYGPAEVGFFSIAAGLTRGSVDLLTVGLSAVLLPTMARAQGSGDPRKSHTIFSDSLRYLVFLGLILAGSGAFWAGPVVRLFYGPSFAPTTMVLQTMLMVGGLSLADATTGAILTTTGRQQQRATLVLVSAGLALVLGPLLVPRFGLAGAAISYALTRIVYTVVLAAQARLVVQGPLPSSALLRLLAAAVAATLPAVAAYSALSAVGGAILAGALYSAVFILLTIVFKAWTSRDADLAIDLCGRAPRLLGWLQPLLQLWRRRFTR